MSNDLPNQRIYRANHMLDGIPEKWKGSGEVPDPITALKMVDSLYNQTDTDFIKVYSRLSKESFLAIANRCNELGIEFMGHVPDMVPLEIAVKAGIKSMEHMNGFQVALSREKDIHYKNFEMGIRPNPMELAQTQSNIRIDTIASLLKEFNCAITPTFTVHDGIAKQLKQYPIDKNPLDSYIPKYRKEKWKNNSPTTALPPFVLQLIEDNRNRKLEIVKLLHEGEAIILAGSDVSGSNPFTYSGFSLQEELQNLVEAGLPPHEALKVATMNASKFVNMSDSLGLVKSGYLADLLILNNNPLENIKHLEKIETVISNGTIYNRQSLDSLQTFAKNLAHNLEKN